jgi:peptidoglycan/LPS O-acetylase OafA/YrhL
MATWDGQRKVVERRIDAVDGLRAMSVVLVIASHQLITSAEPTATLLREYLALIFHGTLGVQFFFVISGFVITRSLFVEWERTGTVSFKNFYLRRFFRLYPAMIVSVVLISIAYRWALGEWSAVSCLGSALTMSEGIFKTCSWDLAHLWSLTVEQVFYLVWPFLFALFLKRPTSMVASFVALSTMLRLYGYFHRGSAGIEMGAIYSLQYLDHFVLGAGLVLVLNSRAGWTPKIGKLHSALWLGLGVALVYVPHFLAHHGRLALFTVPFGGLAIALGATLLLAHCLLLPRSYWSRALSLKPMVFTGAISYSLYLIQQPLYAGTALGQSLGFLGFPINIVLLFGLATLSYRWIEIPFQRKPLKGSATGASAPLPIRRSSNG